MVAKFDSNQCLVLVDAVFTVAKLDSKETHVAMPDSKEAKNDSNAYLWGNTRQQRDDT
jgi:hypothetical protein